MEQVLFTVVKAKKRCRCGRERRPGKQRWCKVCHALDMKAQRQRQKAVKVFVEECEDPDTKKNFFQKCQTRWVMVSGLESGVVTAGYVLSFEPQNMLVVKLSAAAIVRVSLEQVQRDTNRYLE